MVKFYKLRIFKRPASCIGIDLGLTGIKTVELKGNLKNLHLVSFDSVEMPPEAIIDGEIVNKEPVVRKLDSLVQKNNWQGKQVATAIGGRKVVLRILRMPVMPEKELSQAVKFELESYLPSANQEMVVDYINMGMVNEHKDKQFLILLAAVSKAIALAYYELFSTVNLDLVAIDIIPLALKRALALKEKGPTTAFVHLETETTTFFILEEGKISLIRSIASSNKQISEFRINEQGTKAGPTVNQNNNMEAEVELIKELRRTLDFWRAQNQNKEVEKLAVTGNTGNHNKLAQLLTRNLGITVEIGRPLEGILRTDQFLSPEYAVAAGLALRGVTG